MCDYVYRYSYSLIKGIERAYNGSIGLFRIQNFHAICSEIGLYEYENFFVMMKRQIVDRFGVEVFGYGYDSFFIISSTCDLVEVYKFIDNCISIDRGLYLVNRLGCAAFNLRVGNRHPVEIVNDAIESLNYAQKNDIAVCYYHALVNHLILEKRSMHDSAMFKDCSENGRLSLRFQPVVSLPSERILFMETLLKINELDRDVEDVIVSLERTGAVKSLDVMVLDRIERHMHYMLDKHFSINVSLNTIMDSGMKFDIYLEKLMCFRYPTRLILEITETSINRDIGKISEFIRFVKSMGFRVAIDDFGDGSTSFRDLLYLNVDMIKISGCVVGNLNERSRLFIQAICNTADALNMLVVAECVDNSKTIDFLLNLNIEYMQGYYFTNLIDGSLVDIKL